MKTGVVDVGGGLRGVYAAGIFDYCMDRGIRFDLGIGVSAGSANISSYIAGQKKRNYVFYTDYPFRKEYMSLKNFLHQREDQYNRGVDLAEKYEAQGRVLILAPNDTCGVDTLTKDKEALKRFYEKGYQDARVLEDFLTAG